MSSQMGNSSNSNIKLYIKSFVGVCYNAAMLNPYSLGADKTSGGGRTGYYAIELNHRILHITPQTSGEMESTTRMMYNSADYYDAFSMSLSQSVGIGKFFAFSASESYHKYTETINTDKNIESYTYSNFALEDVHINNEDAQKHLKKEYYDAVQSVEKGELSVEKFIETYGTHVSLGATFGGHVYQRLTISDQTAREIASSGHSVSVDVSATYRKVTGGASGKGSSESGSSLEHREGVSHSKLEWVGGDNPMSSSKNVDGRDEQIFSWDKWTESVRKNPMPTALTLIPHYDLFTNAPHLKKGIERYIENHEQNLTVEYGRTIAIQTAPPDQYMLRNLVGCHGGALNIDPNFVDTAKYNLFKIEKNLHPDSDHPEWSILPQNGPFVKSSSKGLILDVSNVSGQIKYHDYVVFNCAAKDCGLAVAPNNNNGGLFNGRHDVFDDKQSIMFYLYYKGSDGQIAPPGYEFSSSFVWQVINADNHTKTGDVKFGDKILFICQGDKSYLTHADSKATWSHKDGLNARWWLVPWDNELTQ